MKLAFGLLLIASSCFAADPIASLYDKHRWFDLRDAIANHDADPLYKGAVAAAFDNLPDAEEYLHQVIAEPGHRADKEDARELLTYIYTRLGHYREAADTGARGATKLFGPFADSPDQSTGQIHYAKLQADKDGQIPVVVNGKTYYWLFDTGANQSVISESEAAAIGLTVRHINSKLEDSDGGSVKAGAAVIPKLFIGGNEIDNIAVMVIPDSRPPMSDWKPGHRGVVGLPVILALHSMRWSAHHTVEFDVSTNARPAIQNLCFDDMDPVTRVGWEGRQLDFFLDTGSDETELWHAFAREFSGFVKKHSVRDKVDLTQVGGTRHRKVDSLPELTLTIGGRNTTLKPANVYPRHVGNGYLYGLIGVDLLIQDSTEFTIDFDHLSVRMQ